MTIAPVSPTLVPYAGGNQRMRHGIFRSSVAAALGLTIVRIAAPAAAIANA